MAYGIKLLGHNNHLLIDGDTKNLYFVGKATRRTNSGDTRYGSDFQSTWVSMRRSNNIEASGNYNSTGERWVYCLSETNGCSTGSSKFTVPDETVYATYTISNCPQTPTVFIGTSGGNHGGVLGIRSLGSNSWEIRVLISYPTGQRSQAFTGVDFYCFNPFTSATTGYGINVYGSNGSAVFSSGKKPLVIKDVVSITSFSGSNISNINVTGSGLSNPAVAYSSMSKPTFLNVDYARLKDNKTFSFTWCGWDSYWGECDGCSSSTGSLTQWFLSAGVHVNPSNNNLVFQFTGIDADNPKCTGASSGITWYKQPLPIYIPVIDGADYD